MTDSGTDARTDTPPTDPFDPPMIRPAEESLPYPHVPPVPERNTKDLILPPLFGVLLAAAVVVTLALIFWPDSDSRPAAAALDEYEAEAPADLATGDGVIRIELDDPLAEAFVNDLQIDPPNAELPLDPGYHWVTIVKEGFHTLDSLVYIAPGATLRFVAPPLVSAEGVIAEAVPQTTIPETAEQPTRRRQSAPGSAQPEPVASPAPRPRSAPPAIPDPSSPADPDPEPTPTAAAPPAPRPAPIEVPPVVEEPVPTEGRVAVTVIPWGSIYVEGRQIGANTDIRTSATLGEGTHMVEAVHPQLGSRTVYVAVVAGQTTEVVIDLR